MGRWHAAAVVRCSGEIAFIVDPDRRKAAELARQHPGARVLGDLDELLAEGGADVAHICTPLETHVDLTERVLRAGFHALVEKPLAPDAGATARLLRLAESQERLLCPVHQFLFQTGVLRALEAVQRFGPVLHVDSVVCSAGAELGHGTPARIAADILPHPLSLIARLLQERIAKAEWHAEQSVAGELRATAHLGGVTLAILISMAGRPTANALRLIGARGTIHVDLFHGFAVVERGEVSRARKIARPFSLASGTILSATANLLARAARGEPAYPGLRELVRRFYLAVQMSGEPPIPADEILDVARAHDTLLAKLR